jgi:putative ABC transport system permease protein
VIGKKIRLDSFIDARPATVVGVLEPCVPYPQDTEIIANIVTSAHHLSATMVTGRIHRMTELFARLAPGADLEPRARSCARCTGHEAGASGGLSGQSRLPVSAVKAARPAHVGSADHTAGADGGTVLVFVIACSNVANLILARTVRRESELGIRAALGASTGALRRTLLAESLLLCVAGARSAY